MIAAYWVAAYWCAVFLFGALFGLVIGVALMFRERDRWQERMRLARRYR